MLSSRPGASGARGVHAAGSRSAPRWLRPPGPTPAGWGWGAPRSRRAPAFPRSRRPLTPNPRCSDTSVCFSSQCKYCRVFKPLPPSPAPAAPPPPEFEQGPAGESGRVPLTRPSPPRQGSRFPPPRSRGVRGASTPPTGTSRLGPAVPLLSPSGATSAATAEGRGPGGAGPRWPSELVATTCTLENALSRLGVMADSRSPGDSGVRLAPTARVSVRGHPFPGPQPGGARPGCWPTPRPAGPLGGAGRAAGPRDLAGSLPRDVEREARPPLPPPPAALTPLPAPLRPRGVEKGKGKRRPERKGCDRATRRKPFPRRLSCA